MVFQSQQRDSWCFGHGATHHLTGECFETWIAAERVESSVDLDTAEDAGVEGREIFVTFLQQSQRLILVPQSEVDDCKRIRRNVTLLRLIR